MVDRNARDLELGREHGPPAPKFLVPTLIFVGLVVAMVSSLGAPLIPTISRADHISLSTAQWVLTAALLTGASSTAVMGRLADGSRPRDVIVLTLAVAVLGCVVSAVSTTFVVLIIGRALQGAGLGLLPVNMAVARRSLPAQAATRAIATLSVSTAVGAGIGYPLTGLIVQLFNFRAAYWFGAIVVLGSLVCAAFALPARIPAPPLRFDLPGAILLALAVVGISLVLSEGGSWGWTSRLTITIVVVGGALIVSWISWELRAAHPLVDLRQLRHRSVLTANVAGFLVSVSMYLIIPIVVEFTQIPTVTGFGFGASVLLSAFVIVPLSVMSFLASRLLVPYERRFGIRSMIPFGALLYAGAALFFTFEHSMLWEAFFTMALTGLGIGFTFAAMPGLIIRSVPHSETGSATGFYQVLRNVGLSFGSALGAAVLLGYTSHGRQLPELGGFQATLLVAAGLGLATAILSFALTGRRAEELVALSDAERGKLEALMTEEAELAGIGLMLGEEHDPFEEEDR
jgi:MFS family permease